MSAIRVSINRGSTVLITTPWSLFSDSETTWRPSGGLTVCTRHIIRTCEIHMPHAVNGITTNYDVIGDINFHLFPNQSQTSNFHSDKNMSLNQFHTC